MSRKRLREIVIELYDMAQLSSELKAAVRKDTAVAGDEALCLALIAAATSIALRTIGTQGAFRALHDCMRGVVMGEEEALAREAAATAPKRTDTTVS